MPYKGGHDLPTFDFCGFSAYVARVFEELSFCQLEHSVNRVQRFRYIMRHR